MPVDDVEAEVSVALAVGTAVEGQPDAPVEMGHGLLELYV